MKEQNSAVEFLQEQIIKFHNWKLNPVFDENCFDEIELHKAIKQAKEMEEICRQQDTNFGYGQGYSDCKAGLEMREPELLTFKSE